jgi:lipoate-protein ligase A
MIEAPVRLEVRREPAVAGAENMRRDLALLDECSRHERAVLRFYTWARPTLSLGWMQDADALVDLQACEHDGIDVVRRPTGGRAILHAQEITYAFASTTRQAPFDCSLQETHDLLARCLQAGLQRLGVQACLSRPTRDPQRRLLRQPCFASSGRAELLVQGRKLLGSAQRRARYALLQHGSLLLGPAHLRIVEYLRDTRHDAVRAAALRRRLQDGTIHLGQLLQPIPDFDALSDALLQGFLQELPHRIDEGDVSPANP